MKQPRAWQRMLSGRILDLLDPTPMDIEIEDIAHGLAFVARWNGQTRGDFAYSVAEHSLLVEEIFFRLNPDGLVKWRLAALLHDAPEYVIGDMISPVGPTDPATTTVRPALSATSRPISAEIRLISCTRESKPCNFSRDAFPPKVLVRNKSLPAETDP